MTSSDRRRFLDEVIAASTLLDDLDLQASAEAWASGAIADWVGLGGDPAALSGELADRHSHAAEAVAWVLGEADLPVDHQPVAAVVVRQRHAADDQSAIVVDYATDGTATHSISVSLDGATAIDGSVGPPGLAEAVAVDPDFELRELGVVDALGQIADALGRATPSGFSPDALANVPLLARRAGVAVHEIVDVLRRGETAHHIALQPRDPDDDAYAAGVVRSALRVTEGLPGTIEPLLANVRRAHDDADPDLDSAAAVAGVDLDSGIGPESVLRTIGAYLAPTTLAVHEPAGAEAIAQLEWADWLGAVIGLVRAGAGTEVTGDALVDLVNRCPEVTTSIPRSDRARVAWAFEQTLYAWQVTGVLDADGVLTAAGAEVLPAAAIAVWGG